MKKVIGVVLMVSMLMACTHKNFEQEVKIENNQLMITKGMKTYAFEMKFTVIYSENDPKLAMRPAGIEHVKYNIASWSAYKGKKADLAEVKKDESTAGDGFDKSILEGNAAQRSPNPYNAGQVVVLEAQSINNEGDTIFATFADQDLFSLRAKVYNDMSGNPKLTYELTPKKKGYFSVGYTGAPRQNIEQVQGIWQPLIWQEKRFPEKPVMTLAYRTPLPTSMAYDGENTIGVMAAPEEFPFSPLPVMKNSRFGVMIRNQDGLVQPQLFAPVPGGTESAMKAGDLYSFTAYLVVEKGATHEVYEQLARKYFGFKDFRRNEISSLNHTFENIVSYARSDYAWFLDSLKGCAYSTDVPGAVKNVSSLNPLELAIVMDDSVMFEQRAYPIMEYMLSREKFLFSLDPEQKIQHPSRKMQGPIAPVSELTSLYNIFDRQNPFLLQMAEEEYHKKRIRNLDVEESGENWINAMHLYEATNDEKYLEKAKREADQYLKNRVDQPQSAFQDPYAGGFFFWPAFVPRWIELTRLYEITRESRYLQAAREGARYYTMFTWMSPGIPDSNLVVNKGGKAPMYWYLKSKGHEQMYFPEEKVAAWRLSEMGLTPESSGTSTGHRAIFMANYAPWMLRLGHYAQDRYLREVAKAAIIGRYRNFPGYHINTARTTAYEKEDYPLHEHKALSVNSFHYNHIMPMASMLLDYLVTDAFVRSDGKINFPSQYIEGYAYMQNSFYGQQPGKFYDDDGVKLWMPAGLLDIDHVELNYIAAYKGDNLYIALMNQSDKPVTSEVRINIALVQFNNRSVEVLEGSSARLAAGGVAVEVAANGITAIKIKGVKPQVHFQKEILAGGNGYAQDYQEIPFGSARAMLITMGNYAQRTYIYLQDDDAVFSEVSLTYTDAGGEHTIRDKNYPYEFTVPMQANQKKFTFRLSGVKVDGSRSKSDVYQLGSDQ